MSKRFNLSTLFASMPRLKQILIVHLSIGVSLYACFAMLDAYLTLTGLNGDFAREGNPVMRYMMESLGLVHGMVFSKILVLLIVVVVAIFVATGVEKDADWLYYFTLKVTRNWMKRRKRYWLAFAPLYSVAFSQGVAAATWFYILTRDGGI